MGLFKKSVWKKSSDRMSMKLVGDMNRGGDEGRIINMYALIGEYKKGKDVEKKIEKKIEKINEETLDAIVEYFCERFDELCGYMEEGTGRDRYTEKALFLPPRIIELSIEIYKRKGSDEKVKLYSDKFENMKKKLSEFGYDYEQLIIKNKLV